jgi:hypothetical protein
MITFASVMGNDNTIESQITLVLSDEGESRSSETCQLHHSYQTYR